MVISSQPADTRPDPGERMLHQDTYDFWYKICENGHLTYSGSGTVSDEFCSRCGAPFLTKCPKCDKALPATFRSPVYFTSRTAVNIPRVPAACANCGHLFPWALREVTKLTLTEAEALALVSQICFRFHRVARQLRERREDRSTLDVVDEYDVQDLLHALLRLHFDDIRTEEWTPSYAGGAARMDFLLKDYGIVLEVKKTRSGLQAKDIGSQLIEDIARYKQHPDCRRLLCFVYDPEERIGNRVAFARDLEGIDKDVQVKVIISPGD